MDSLLSTRFGLMLVFACTFNHYKDEDSHVAMSAEEGVGKGKLEGV